MAKYYPIGLLLAIIFAGPQALAQQLPQYSLYMLNPYRYHPAYAGLENSLVATGVYRQQWADLEGAPVNFQVNAHLPLYMVSSGVGLKAESDQIGAHQTTQIALTYSYHLELGRNTLLSAGFSGGYLQYGLDGTKLRAPQGTYVNPGAFTHNDVLLPEGKITAGTAVFEAGLYLQARQLEIGLSVLPVFVPVLEEASGSGGFRLQTARQYVLGGMYQLALTEDLGVKTSVLAKSDFSLTQIEFSSLIGWRNNIFAGASYRGYSAGSSDAVVLAAVWRVNESTSIGYAYDLPLSPLRASNRGSHELLLRYSLSKTIGKGVLPPVIYNPRFY